MWQIISRKNRLGLIVVVVCLTVSHARAADEPASLLAQRLRENYPNTRITGVAESVLPGLFEVLMGRNIAYTDANGRYFLFGHLFDMPTQRDLTAERKDRLQRVDFASLPLQDAIKTTRGNGSRVMAVFSDPDCPYCRNLEPELAKLSDVTVYTFLMPLIQLHANARAKSIAVWCAPDRSKAWALLMLRNRSTPSAICEHPIDRNLALAERLQINGTPTLIASDGRMLPGAANAAQIEAWFAQSATGAVPPQAGSGVGQ